MIAEILPPSVAAAEAIGPEPEAEPIRKLFPAEEAMVRTAGPRRQAEFAEGRRCAHQALSRLGVPAAPVLAGRAGQPLWPAGVTGSITHCAGYRACAVARAADVAAIGIDAEPDAGLPAGLIESLASAAERARIGRLGAEAPVVAWDRLLFSAKEAVAKLWYPLTGQWLGSRGAAVFPAATFPAAFPAAAFPAAAGTFEAHVAGIRLTGRWLARGGLIVTAVTCAPAEKLPEA